MSPSRAKNIFMPTNINSIVILLIFSVTLDKNPVCAENKCKMLITCFEDNTTMHMRISLRVIENITSLIIGLFDKISKIGTLSVHVSTVITSLGKIEMNVDIPGGPKKSTPL